VLASKDGQMVEKEEVSGVVCLYLVFGGIEGAGSFKIELSGQTNAWTISCIVQTYKAE
jgi:hypothetical protein